MSSRLFANLLHIIIDFVTLTKCLFLFIAACIGFVCPRGSTCRVCEETGNAYCKFSCSIDNGGCPPRSTCAESGVTCPPDQCCSPQIDCEGMVERILYE